MGDKLAYTPPNPDNYMIGKGVLKIALYTGAVPDEEDYVDVGNCPRFEYEMTEEVREHFSSRQAQQEQDAETVIQTGYTVNFTLDEIAVENLRMFMKATLAPGSNVLYANQNVSQLYVLKFESDNSVGPDQIVDFHKCKLTPNGAFSLISQDYTTLNFSGKGLSDRTLHAESPFITTTLATTTTTTTT